MAYTTSSATQWLTSWLEEFVFRLLPSPASTSPSNRPATFARPQSAPSDTHCDRQPVAPRAEWFVHLPMGSWRTNPFLDLSPGLPSPSSPPGIALRRHSTVLCSADRPSSANTLPAISAIYVFGRG